MPNGQELRFHAERRMIEAVATLRPRAASSASAYRKAPFHTSLPTLLKRVAQIYPNLRPEIEVDGLVAGDLHLALLLEPVNDPSVRSRRLYSFPVAFIASQNIKFHDKPIVLEDILKHRIITFARHTQPFAALRAIVDRAGLDATI